MGEVILGVDFGASKARSDRIEARVWEDVCGQPKGSFRGIHDGCPIFVVDELPVYVAPDKDGA